MAASEIKAYMSIGKFLGDSSDDPERYFRKIERFHRCLNYDQAKKANMLPFGLEGKGLDFYESCSEAVRADYNLIKNAIIAHFKSNKSEILRWDELSKLKKTKNQSVSDFYDLIRKKSEKMEGISDRNLLLIFMGGLENPLRN